MLRLLSILLFSFASVAYADDMNCKVNGPNGATYEASFHAGQNFLTASLSVNGHAIPAVRDCLGWAHGSPLSQGRWRCPFGQGELRYELYPIFADTGSGKPGSLYIIPWNGDHVGHTITGTDCK